MTGFWTVVLPVKPFAVAKSRLCPWAGSRREELARSFFLDTLSAVLRADGISRVIVVTSDREAVSAAVSMGALAVDDHPRTGLNTAVLKGASYARGLEPESPVAVVAADLPALKSAELSQVLVLARCHSRAVLADHTGRGTTVLTAARAQLLHPAFEGSSRHSHRLTGAHEITSPNFPSVRLDVDTADDLRAAERLGLGRHTVHTLSALSLRR
ncbi:2-phospho-L-lactate guanylyltransferase [Streptomyces carpinensis]|uniref:Phosphoenolpyruvate guanylyltransferase n=1 Tax=Streptomyces carpinensis TaxID=66369 RepID=A0ABV1WFJ3_9ACTN|nr:2-phospho-L-lactate guanylyltransferase [Streptomyces carpinensis]